MVDDAAQAYEQSVANGAKGVRPPVTLKADSAGDAGDAGVVVSEVALYGDVVLRYVSGTHEVRGREREGGREGVLRQWAKCRGTAGQIEETLQRQAEGGRGNLSV